MVAIESPISETIDVNGIALDMITMGQGQPLLFLHGAEGPDVPSDAHLRELARHYRVIAPWHPGFGVRERPEGIRDISDLAYFYLDLVEKLDIHDGILVGCSFGGWIAAEMMVRNSSVFSQLVLSGPLGIKVRDRESRDIADFFAMTDEEFLAIGYADPAKGRRDITALNDRDLAGHFRSRESLALFTWKPYMHNPQLRQWLHRIKVPTLVVAGKQDRFVFDGYYKAFTESLPQATFRQIDDAGHFPHVEQAKKFADLVVDHLSQTSRAQLSA